MDYFHNCSKEYLHSISPSLYSEVVDIIKKLPKRSTQAEINKDLFWILTAHGWSYDSTPAGLSDHPTEDLEIEQVALPEIKRQNQSELCLTSTTLEARWRSDYAKIYDNKLVQMEAQFGKVESMFKDFCGFKIAWYERRLALGVEIVMCEPGRYFAHRKSATSGMAYFDIAKKTLPAIGLECPIWLLGIQE
jgi:hypothetical protein